MQLQWLPGILQHFRALAWEIACEKKGDTGRRSLVVSPKNQTNMIQSCHLQSMMLGTRKGQTQPSTNQNVLDIRGEHSLLLVLRDTSFCWGARGRGASSAQSFPGAGWLTHHRGMRGTETPGCCSSAGVGRQHGKGW